MQSTGKCVAYCNCRSNMLYPNSVQIDCYDCKPLNPRPVQIILDFINE